MSMTPVAPDVALNCQTCGACCSTKLWDVEVLASVDTKVPEHMVKLDRLGIFPVMRDRKGWCIALKGTPDMAGSCVSCRIYKNRPTVCREFPVGSDDCHIARRKLAARLSEAK